MEFGKKLQDWRKEKKLSQEALAEELGVVRQTISKWECGETTPDLKQALKLAEIFGVSLDELVGRKLDDVYLERISNTERLAGIIIKMLKVMGVVLYFGVLLLLVGVMVYYFRMSKREVVYDYTKEYQTDFTCNYEGVKTDYFSVFQDGEYVLEYCDYNNPDKEFECNGVGKIKLGDNIVEALEAVKIIKKGLVDNGATCK